MARCYGRNFVQLTLHLLTAEPGVIRLLARHKIAAPLALVPPDTVVLAAGCPAVERGVQAGAAPQAARTNRVAAFMEAVLRGDEPQPGQRRGGAQCGRAPL